MNYNKCIFHTARPLTLRVQQLGEAQALLSDVEGLLEVVCGVRSGQLVKLD